MSALGNSLRRRLALSANADFFIEEITGSNITQSDIEGWLGGYAVIGFQNNNGIISFRLRQIGTPSETTNFNNIHLKLRKVTILNSSYLFPQNYADSFAGSVNSVFTLQENLSSLSLSFRGASNFNFYFSNQINVVNFGNSFQNTALEKIIIFNKLTQLSNGNNNQHGASNCRYFSANKAVLLENQQGLTLSGDTFITRGEYENTPSGVNQQLDYIRNQFTNVIYAQNYTLPSAPTNIQTTQVGGTYVELDQTSFPSHVNDYLGFLVFEDGFFLGFFDNSYIVALTPETSYNFKIRLVDEFFNISEPARFSVLMPALPSLFQNIKAFYPLQETSGNVIELINGIGGIVNGNPTRTGDGYIFSNTSNPIDEIIIPDTSGDLSPIGNSPFSVYIEFEASSISIARLIGKTRSFSGNNQEWYITIGGAGDLVFQAFNDSTVISENISFRSNFAIQTNQRYKALFTWDGDPTNTQNMRVYFDKIDVTNVSASVTQPSSFQVPNTNSSLYIGRIEAQTATNNRFNGLISRPVILKKYIQPSEVSDFFDEVENYII